jgi:hypothetical protein
MELHDLGDPLQFVKELWVVTDCPASARQTLGTAWCGPACRVGVGAAGEKPPVTRLGLLPA